MLSYVRREPSALLLAGQLLGVLVYPFMQGSEVGQALFSLFGIAILGLVVFAVSGTRSLTWVALLFGIPASVLLLIQAVTGDDELLPYSSAFEAVLYFYAAGALIRQVLEDHEVTRDEVFGVGATFTLVAWAFAYTFTVCQAIEPGSFASGADASGDRTWMELLFLSFSNLSSHGPQRRHPGRALRALAVDARAARGPGLHRDGGGEARRAHRAAAASAGLTRTPRTRAMARARIELATPRFSVVCSTN